MIGDHETDLAAGNLGVHNVNALGFLKLRSRRTVEESDGLR
jgi:hypothetical protein